MRDDLKKNFLKLNTCYSAKEVLYKNLLTNCRECDFYVSAGNFNIIEDMLEKSNDMITEIDNIDYEVAQIKSDICAKTGIEYHNFDHYFFIKNNFKECFMTSQLIDKVKPLLRESIELRDNLVKRIQFEQSRLSNSIDSIARTQALNTRFHIMQG